MGFLTKRTFRIVVPPVGRLPHFPLSQSGERGERRIGYRLGAMQTLGRVPGHPAWIMCIRRPQRWTLGKRGANLIYGQRTVSLNQLERRKWEMASK